MAKQDCKVTSNFLVYNHLLNVAPKIAQKFRTNHKVPEGGYVNVTLGEIKDSFQTPNLKDIINSLVYCHLVKVMPDLANQFQERHFIRRPSYKLEHVIDHFERSSIKPLSYWRITDNNKVNLSRKEKSGNKIGNSQEDQNNCITVQKLDKKSFSDKEDDSNFVDELEKYFPCFQDCFPARPPSEEDISIIDLSSSSEEEISIIDLSSSSDSKTSIIDLKRHDVSQNNKSQNYVSQINESQNYVSQINESQNDVSQNMLSRSNTSSINCVRQIEICDDDISGYCNISDCDAYTNLHQTVTKCKVRCELDKIILYIFNQNILVRKIHQIVTSTKISNNKEIKKAILDKGILKVGNYNVEEREIVRKNWNALIATCKIKEPSKVLESLSNLSTRNGNSYEELLKRNVIGMYLSQGLLKVRHAADVFQDALTNLYLLKIQKFKRISQAENDQITEYVKNKGISEMKKCDWKELTRSMNRPEKYAWNIQNHYKILQVNSKGKMGAFSFTEDKMVLDSIFSNKKFSSVETIPKNENFDRIYQDLANQMGRYIKYVKYHWITVLKPILLQYHAGTLNMDIRRCLFNYLHEEGVKYVQDIQWDRLLQKSQFAGHSRPSLTLVFNNMKTSTIRALGCTADEVSVAEIVNQANAICDPKNVNVNVRISGSRAKRKFEIVKYYKSLVEKNV